MPRKLLVADLFCGAGGTTTGAMHAINSLGHEVEFVAVNHWPVAIATHSANHPNVRHFCKDLDTANPNEIVPEGELDLLLASPECRFHSEAQGGRPLDEQSRASAWHVVRWAERLYIRRIVVENVPRFLKWGPLDRKKRPLKSKEGATFRAWVAALESLGYRVEWRVLNAADYGTPQSRKRLFIQARRDGRRIVWPERTHAPRGDEDTLNGRLLTWTPARSAIKFDKYRHLAKPIEDKGLAESTLKRIAEGVERFVRLPNPQPFLVTLRQYAGARSLDEPMPTITTSGNHHVLIEPFLIPQDSASPLRSLDDPLPTLRTTSRGVAVIEPFLVESNHSGDRAARSIDDPFPTITQRNGLGIIEPFILPQHGESRARSVDDPLPTIVATRAHPALLEPHFDGSRLVLLHRMLQPEELGLGQDFEDYEFTGTREQQTMQIGNAVPIKLAQAMTGAALHDLRPIARASSDDEEAAA